MSTRRATAILLLVLGVAVGAAVLAGVLGPKFKSGGYVPPDAESVRADKVLAAEFHGGAPNLVLLVSGESEVDSPAMATEGRALAERVRSWPGVAFAQSYWDTGYPQLRSQDGKAGLVLAQLSGDEGAAQETAAKLVPAVTGERGQIVVSATGSIQTNVEAEDWSKRDLLAAELIAAPLTFLILLFAFRSLIAVLMPLVVGAVAVVGTAALLSVLSRFIELNIFAMNITTALGFALAVDYSLFIITRFREELIHDPGSAVRRTLSTAGRTVIYSAITVALGLAAMLVFPLVFLRSMAVVGMIVVALAAVAAIALLIPALALLGPNIDRLTLFRRRSEVAGGWGRIARTVMRRPVIFGGVVTVLLVLLAIPFGRAEFGTIDDRVLPARSAAHVAADQLRDRFPGVETTPVSIVLPHTAAESTVDYAARVSQVANVRAVQPVPSERGTWLRVAAGANPDSAAGRRLIADLRGLPAPGERLVTGGAADLVDTREAIVDRLGWAALIVLGSMTLLLFLFTRSVIVPVKAAVLSALSLTASFGAMVWIFQEGHLRWLVGDFTVTGFLDLSTLVLVFCLAFGLSMDYEVFLLSRIREEYLRTGDNEGAVAEGLASTGRVVSAAALIVAVVLGVLASSGLTMLKTLGVGLAIAVIMDATLVRGVLLPATMKLLGPLNWWPFGSEVGDVRGEERVPNIANFGTTKSVG
ncbi:MMPL family transporter [Pseudonocardiaceae bacterium YIM PH 21723]|nr:MMPL family transporter [Pseudonocardiaceae bacterium YIM PH 21723]